MSTSDNAARRRARVIRRVLLGLFVLVLGGLGTTAWYAYNKGFTKKWRGLIQEEFRKQGFEVTLKRLTLDPFRGLVAKEVQIFDAKNRRRTLAVVDEMIVGINYANAIQGEGKSILETLDLRDANLSLPLDPSNPRRERVEITKLNARLFLPPRQIYLARAEAEIAGIRIYATGRLINPQAFKFKRSEENKERNTEIAEKVLGTLRKLKPRGEPPLLAVQFSGDLAEPDAIAVDMHLDGRGIRRGDYHIEELKLAATVRNGALELQRCEIRDANGTLQAHASYRPARKELELRLRSELDLPALVRAFDLGARISDWTFYSPPSISLNGNADFAGEKPEFEIRGQVRLGKFAYKSVIFEGLSSDGSWDGGERWSVRDLRLLHRTGEVTADFLRVPGDFRARVRGGVNPRLIAPLLSGEAAEWFAQFRFGNSPRFAIDVPESLAQRHEGTKESGITETGTTRAALTGNGGF